MAKVKNNLGNKFQLLFFLFQIKDPHLRHNPSHGGGKNKEKNFWDSVKSTRVNDLSHVYKLDLHFFGYSVQEYFDKIGYEKK